MNRVDFIVGAELTQVCIGANEVILNFFPDGISVSVYSTNKFFQDNSFLFETLCDSRKRIRQIGKTVKNLDVRANNIAALMMSDGSEIVLTDDSTEFEAIVFKSDKQVVAI